jgi:hypothetical protein
MVLLICTSSLLVNNLESVGLASFPIVIASLPLYWFDLRVYVFYLNIKIKNVKP